MSARGGWWVQQTLLVYNKPALINVILTVLAREGMFFIVRGALLPAVFEARRYGENQAATRPGLCDLSSVCRARFCNQRRRQVTLAKATG